MMMVVVVADAVAVTKVVFVVAVLLLLLLLLFWFWFLLLLLCAVANDIGTCCCSAFPIRQSFDPSDLLESGVELLLLLLISFLTNEQQQ